MVMLHHYSQQVCARGLSDSLFYKAMSAQAGFIGVAVFFFLSGYGLMESEQKTHLNLLQFFKRRFLKIYLPVITVTCLWTLIAPFVLRESPFSGLSFDIGNNREIVVGNIFYNFGDGVLWFVRVIICLYVVFYIFSCIYVKYPSKSLILLGLLTIILTFIIDRNFSPEEAISIPFFSLGIILSLLKCHRYCFFITLGLLILYLVFGFLVYDFAVALHCGLNIIFMSLLILLLFIKDIDFKVPAFIGIISFDLYLVHHKVLKAMITDAYSMPSLWVYMTIVFVATLLFYLLRTKLLKI